VGRCKETGKSVLGSSRRPTDPEQPKKTLRRRAGKVSLVLTAVVAFVE
jgi:hypothetical protein